MTTYRNDAGDLVEWTGDELVRFGKHVHKRWAEVPDGYLLWLVTGNGSIGTVKTARMESKRRKLTDGP